MTGEFCFMLTTYGLVLLKVPVSDIARSAAFYGGGLGLEEVFYAPEYSWAQYQTGDLGIALYVPGKSGGESPLGRDLDFHLQTDDLEGLVERLKSGGIDVGEGIGRGDDNWDCLNVRDPDGNLLKIFGPQPEHDGAG